METLASETTLNEFEQTYNFHSLRSYIDEMYKELDACNTREEYDALLETLSDYLEYSEGRLIPRISSAAYQRIADESGVFYVDGVKHTVVPGKVLVETVDPVSRAVREEAIDYEIPFTFPSQTRDEETINRYTDRTYEIPDYKVFARTNLIRNVIVDSKGLYGSVFRVQVHMSSQKRKALIGWNSYTTRFQIERFHFDVTIDGKRYALGAYDEGYVDNSGDERYNYYVEIHLNPMDPMVGFKVTPMPGSFECIIHRVHTNATGDCGCLTHIAPCKPVPHLYMTECRGVYRPYL